MVEISLVLIVLPRYWTFGFDKVGAATPDGEMDATCFAFRFGFVGIDVTLYRPND